MKKQNINVGDRLLCKKDFSDDSNRFRKGRYYLVWDITNDISYDDDDYIYQIEDEQDMLYGFYYSELLCSHFYMKNELRNIKLKKLNEKAGY